MAVVLKKRVRQSGALMLKGFSMEQRSRPSLRIAPLLVLVAASLLRAEGAWYQTEWPGVGPAIVFANGDHPPRIHVQSLTQHGQFWFDAHGPVYRDLEHKLELTGKLDPQAASTTLYLTDAAKKQSSLVKVQRIALAKSRKESLAEGVDVGITQPILDTSTPFLKALSAEINQRANGEWNAGMTEARQTLADAVGTGEVPRYDFNASFGPEFLNDHIASFTVATYVFSGGAHGSPSEKSLNFDFDDGTLRELTLDDLFDLNKGFDTLADLCLEDLKRQGASSITNGEVKQITLEQLTNFTLSPTGFTIIFDPYVVGSYAEGTYRSTLPWSKLASILRPSSPARIWLPH